MKVSATQIATFINMIAPIAIEQATKHGGKIFPSVCIAQAAHETGFGTSKTMMRYNGLFGIKVGSSAYHFGNAWKGESYNSRTTEYYGNGAEHINDNFRAYSSVSDSVEDYFDLLCVAKRYKAALNAEDYKACIRAIAPSYATGETQNHAYSNAIINIIGKYNLTKYDTGEAIPFGNPYTLTEELLKKGSKGESVRWLQWELDSKGYPVGAIDGAFGTKTETAVKEFQKDVFVDGIVGPLTFSKLR